MPMGKISLREILSRPTRALLTFTSIVLGVAAVVSVFLTTSNTRAAQKQMLRVVSGRADLEIVANGARGFPITALEETKQVPGVKLVVPTINRPTTLFAGERTANARVLVLIHKSIRRFATTKSFKVIRLRTQKRFLSMAVSRSRWVSSWMTRFVCSVAVV